MEFSILVDSDGGNVTLAVLDKPKKMLQAVLSVPIQEVSKCKMCWVVRGTHTVSATVQYTTIKTGLLR